MKIKNQINFLDSMKFEKLRTMQGVVLASQTALIIGFVLGIIACSSNKK